MAVFRYKRGIDATYVQQGYIYFTSRNIEGLPKRRQEKLRQLMAECGGPYAAALEEFVTTDAGVVEVSMRHHISERTLHRIVARYYKTFLRRAKSI